MDWADSPAEAAFRREVRAFIEAHLPARYRSGGRSVQSLERAWEFDRKSPDPAAREAADAWAQALAERGWVAPHWPREYGGAGLSVIEQFVFKQELARAGAPPVGGSAVRLLGPTLIVHGTPEQQRRHLTPILRGERAWSQGYSEPGAGSDLASLQTSAVRDGDEYIVNGQKVWTSGAHTSDSLYILVRTDPQAPKHQGLSFLLLEDAGAPGVTVQPLIDMCDRHLFNETFFEDVRIPVASRVGEENRGWYVGMTLLDFERSNIVGAVEARRRIEEVVDHALGVGHERARLDHPAIRASLADRYVEAEVMFQFSFRIISMQKDGVVANHEASVAKLFASELRQRVAQTTAQLFGLYGALWPDDGTFASPARAYVESVSETIRGGTSEVQRNIIATRGLALPRG